MQASPGGVNER